MQERPSASVTLMACGIVSGYSPPCSIVSKRRPVPFMLGSWGRFSGVISSNLWVSFIRRLSSVTVAPNVCLSALNLPPNMVAVQRPHDADPREHRRSAQFRDQDQGLDRGLPFGGVCFFLW